MAGFPNLWSRPARSPRPRRACLRLDNFEDRTVPAVVNATVAGGVLTLTAVDANSDESLTLTPGTAPGVVHVHGNGGTTIKLGNAAEATDVDVKFVKSVSFNLKGGNDSATVQGVKLAGYVMFNAANMAGSKTVAVNGGSVIGQGVTVNTGTGIDNLTVDNTRIGNGLTVKMGGGDNDNHVTVSGGTYIGGSINVTNGGLDDVTTISNTTVGGSVNVTHSNGQTSVSLADVSVGAGLAVGQTGVNNDSSLVRTTVGGVLKYTGGQGNDNVTVNDLTAGGKATFDMKNGFNKVLIDTTGNGTSNTGSSLLGGLTVNGGNKKDEVSMGSQKPVLVAGPTDLKLGNETSLENVAPGGDFVQIDDTTFLDAVNIDLGSGRGTDSLAIEQNITTALAPTTFADKVTVTMGQDDDDVDLGFTGDPNRQVVFAAPGGPQGTSIDGGAGSDTLNRNNGTIDGASIGTQTNFYKNFETVTP